MATKPVICGGTVEGLARPSATSPKQALLNICKGAVIGVGAILPGISGGILCVAFGIYQPMMSLLSHPAKALKTYYRLLIPVLIGWVIGFVGLARGVDLLFSASPAPAIWLFIGLIAGTLPSIYRTAGERGRTAGAWIACGASFALFLGWMILLNVSAAVQIQPSLLWWFICGLLWGIGLIVPGMSPSAFLIYLGLYQPLTAGIADLSLGVILPLVAGIVVVVLVLARLVNRLFERAYALVFHALLGIVVASMLAIVPLEASYAAADVAVYGACFVAGCLGALAMDRLSVRIEGRGTTA